MENLRVVLWAMFIGMVWITIQTWQQEYAPPAAVPAADVATGPAPTANQQLPNLSPDGAASTAAPVSAETTPVAIAPTIRVTTDVLDLEISTAGGTLQSAKLLRYPVHKDQPDQLVQLLSTDPVAQYELRTGIRAASAMPDANHNAIFTATANSYALADGQDELRVPLLWRDASGVSVTKTYIFTRGYYGIRLEQHLQNDSAAPYRAAPYLQLQRVHVVPERSMLNTDTYSFVGPVVYDGEKYDKLKPEKLAEEPFSATLADGWIASIQHHFLTAAIPPVGSEYQYQSAMDGERYLLTAMGPAVALEPGTGTDFSATLFVGPKLQKQLSETAKGLDLTVDYGILALLAKPLFWLLSTIHGYVGNWGWSIILCTMLIKLVFYKLTETSGRSMAKMRKLTPRLKALQDRYKDDRQVMSQKLMELYKQEKVNPAAGCLPMLIQIPFFIAYYWVLLESVEMRQAPFVLWITDLSSREPYFLLPLLMGIAMFVQQKLNPAPPDPIQAKVMQFLPVIFTVFFAFFPAGLVLYWLTNSVLSILQQWRVNKVVAAEG